MLPVQAYSGLGELTSIAPVGEEGGDQGAAKEQLLGDAGQGSHPQQVRPTQGRQYLEV